MSDNVAAVYWLRKGSTTTTKPPAYLLRLQAFHQRHHRYVARHDYIPGPANAMADDCSRLWHLTDAELLAYFNTTYPQTVPWQQCHLSKPMFSGLISALRRKPSTLQCVSSTPAKRSIIGQSGSNFAPNVDWTYFWPTLRIRSPTSLYLLSATAMEGWPSSASPSQLSAFQTLSVPLARRLL